jgi:hypothetical protein
MGRPIQKKWFGPATLPGSQIVVNGVRWADNSTSTGAYIVKQTGSAAYVVSNGVKTEIVFMVNAASTAALLPGQCFINATPFGGSALPCYKIAQFRVDVFNIANTVPRETGAPVPDGTSSYSWSTQPAVAPGQADLITGSGAVGAILSITAGAAGFGYFTAPSVSFTGGGVGGAAHATVANGVVTGYVIDSAGSGYANGNMTIGTPPASVTATATGTATAGAVDALVTVSVPGGYYTAAPAVTVLGGNSDATAHAVVSGGHVTSIVIDVPGTGYTTPVAFTIAAPAAAVQATASATISV